MLQYLVIPDLHGHPLPLAINAPPQTYTCMSLQNRASMTLQDTPVCLPSVGASDFFCISALCMQVGRWKSLIGSSAALGLMTVISVGIGSAFKSLPDVLKSSLPVGQYLGAALMLLFGLRTISVSIMYSMNPFPDSIRVFICD